MNSKAGSVLLIVVLAALLAAGCAVPGAGGGAAATVNGKSISTTEFDKQFKAARDSMVEQGFDPNSAEGKSTLDQVRVDVLNQMIDTELLRQAAQKEAITVTEADIDARLKQIKQDAGGEETFKNSLKESKLTEQEFRGNIVRDQIIYERLYEKVAKTVPTSMEQVRARHILVASQKEADDIQTRLAKGADFAALAKDLSLDPQTKDNGGDLGFFPRQVLEPSFENVIFNLKVQQSGIVETELGYHVVQVVERDPNRIVSPEILQYLGEEALTTYLANARSQAKIVYVVSLPATATPSQ